MSSSKTLLEQSLKTLGLLFFIIVIGLFVDSKFVANNFYEHAQWLNNLIVIVVFLILFLKATSRTKEMLLYAVLIGFIGEYVFSVGLGMYEYRLKNIPHYVPFGHAIVFVLVYYFSRKSKVKKYSKKIELLCTLLIVPTAFYFLLFKNDVFGFVCTLLVFFFLRKYPKEKLFYLTMYCVVAILEFVGTGLECWKWPSIAFNSFSFLSSANPPIGISLFYFGLDRGTMSIYKRRHKKAWNRLKSIRAINS